MRDLGMTVLSVPLADDIAIPVETEPGQTLQDRRRRLGRCGQVDASLFGDMSAMLTTVPSSSMNAIESGISVLRIQKQCCDLSSNTNTMP